MPDIQTTVGGLRAIELTFRPLRDIATGRSICFLSRTQLNTPELGTLMPEAFRSVAEFSGQSKKLFPLELLQLAEAVRALDESERVFEWVSLDIPLRMLRDRATPKLLEKICEQFSISPGKFCFVMPEAVLAETKSNAADTVANLRKHGYHIMLSGFGESGCPFIKLSEFNADYVMLSPSLTTQIGKNERTDQAVHSIISFINDLNAEPVADGVKNSKQAGAFYEFGCNYCAGSLSGDYMPLSELIK